MFMVALFIITSRLEATQISSHRQNHRQAVGQTHASMLLKKRKTKVGIHWQSVCRASMDLSLSLSAHVKSQVWQHVPASPVLGRQRYKVFWGC